MGPGRVAPQNLERELEMEVTKLGGWKWSLHGDHILTLICGVSRQVCQK